MTKYQIDEKTIDSILNEPQVFFDGIQNDSEIADIIIEAMNVPMSRRNFLKVAAAGAGMTIFGSRKLFGKKLEIDVIPAYNNACDIFEGDIDAAWLSIAYVINGIKEGNSYDLFYNNMNKINNFIKDSLAGYTEKTKAKLSVAYAMSGFDEKILGTFSDIKKLYPQDSRAIWGLFAFASAGLSNRSDLNKIEAFLSTYRNYETLLAPEISQGYLATGFDRTLVDAYKDLIYNYSSMTHGEFPWIALAYSNKWTGDYETFKGSEGKKKIGTFMHDLRKRSNITNDVTSMLALAYSISNYADVLTPFKTYYKKIGRKDAAALLTIAYAVALNPQNKIFPRAKNIQAASE